MTLIEATADTERRPLLEESVPEAYGALPISEEYSTEDNQNKDHSDEATRLAAIQALPWHKRPSMLWILPFVFLLAIVSGVGQAPQEQLIVKIVCKEYFNDRDFPSLQNSTSFSVLNTTFPHDTYYDDPCNTPAIQALAALTLGRIRFLKYVSAIFTLGYITSLSDIKGRKALIFLTLVPTLLTQMLIVYMARPTVNIGMWILYLDSLLVGLLGAGLLLQPCLNAYVADCTPREGRSLIIGYLMVALSLGLILGPILGGYLIKLTGDIASAMTISIIIHGVLTIYAIILPESLPKFARNAKDSDPINNFPKAEEASILLRIKNGVLAILDPLLLFLPGRIDSSSDVNVTPSNYTLVTLVVAYGLIQFASTGISIVFIPYTNLAFHWTALEDNLYYSVQGAASFVVYIVIFPGLQKLYKRFIEKSNPRTTTPPSFSDLDFETNDESLHPTKLTNAEIRQKTVWNDLSFFIFGSFAYLIGYLIVPFFGTVSSLFISCFIRSLASVCLPSFYSLITSFVPIHQMGKALGGICVIDTIIMSMSSLLYGWVFAQTSSTIPSAFFFVSSAFSLLTILFGFSIWKAFKRVDTKKS